MTTKLKGKVAVITGSGRGIGKETPLILAEQGADIVVNDLDAAAAQEVAASIQKQGRRTHVSSHDISQYSQAHAFIQEAAEKMGRIDILVNNAGITRDSMLHKCDEKT